jgi:hypothetical protein
MAKRKTISRQQIIGERGYHLFSERVMAVGLTCHQTGRLEAGIDGFIELRDPDTGEVRAQFVGAQIKTRDSDRFSEETDTSFSFPLDARDLDYWLSSNAPVILVVVRLEDQLICWKSIQSWFDTPAKKASRKIVFDKTSDLLTKASAPALAQMVASFGKPGTMVPPMRADEQLDTNLLRAIFPAQVNVASTDLSYVEIRQAMLHVEDPAPIDWVSYGKRIFSFRDLDSPVFKAVVEPGTAELIGRSRGLGRTARLRGANSWTCSAGVFPNE